MKLSNGYELKGEEFFRVPSGKIIKINFDAEIPRYTRALIYHRLLVLLRRIKPGVYVTHPDGIVIRLITG